MIGSPAWRGAVASVGDAGCPALASTFNAVNAAMVARVAMAGSLQRRGGDMLHILARGHPQTSTTSSSQHAQNAGHLFQQRKVSHRPFFVATPEPQLGAKA